MNDELKILAEELVLRSEPKAILEDRYALLYTSDGVDAIRKVAEEYLDCGLRVAKDCSIHNRPRAITNDQAVGMLSRGRGQSLVLINIVGDPPIKITF